MRRTILPALALLLGATLAPATSSAAEGAARSVRSEGAREAGMDRSVVRATGDISVLMHARPGRWGDAVARAKGAGLAIGSRYESIDVFVAYGPADVFHALARDDAFEYLEANRRLRYFTETSHQATRGQNVLNGAVTLPDGSTIDGTGVGVAVVDSGIDGTHPDLTDHMGQNVKTVCTTPQFVATGATGFTTCLGPKTYVPVRDSDTISAGGHGTHVAGIVAGDGTASNGRFHGAAPESTLYGISAGTTISVENGLDGLEWVLENHDLVSPAIKVVNNSW
ncbi:MAG: S8 family serine peptidase, partial [Actinomycetota bacterium]